MSERRKINPCPLCGANRFYVTRKFVFENQLEIGLVATVKLRCTKCGIELCDYTKNGTYETRVDSLIRKWNRLTGGGNRE